MIKVFLLKKDSASLIVGIWLLSIFLIGSFLKIQFWDLAKFIYYQIMLFFSFGSIILKLINLRFKNSLCFCFTAYALGYVVNIMIYAMFLILEIQNYIKGYCIVVSIFCVIYMLFMNHKEEFQEIVDNQEFKILLILLLIALFIGFFSFQCNNLSIEMKNYFNGINQDNVFWLNKTVEVTKRYPVPNLSILGLNEYYHYFSSFILSFLYFATGIEIFNLCFVISYCMNIFLLLGGTYTLLKENLNSKLLIYLGIVAILFCTGVEKMTNVYYMHHIYVGSFGFSEGFAVSMFALCLFFKVLDDKQSGILKWIITVILFSGALGLKYPCACIVLVVIGINCIFMLFNKNTIKRSFAVGTSYLIVFIVFSFLFVIGPNQPLTEGGIIRQGFSWVNTLFERNYYYIKYAPILEKIFKSEIVAVVITIALYIITTNFVMNYFLITAFGMKIKNIIIERTWYENQKNVSLAIAIVAGYVLFFFFWQDGFSQVYFMFSIYPLGILLAFSMLECYIQEKKIVMYVGVLLMIISLGFSFRTLAPYMLRGFIHLSQQNEEFNLDGENTITRKEYEGLVWIRDNLNENVVLITNKILGDGRQTSFVTSAYSERQVYIQGQRYNNFNTEEKENRLKWVKMYFNGDNDAKETLIDDGVSYAVLYKNITDYDAFPQNDSIVFENEDISVLKLEKRND